MTRLEYALNYNKCSLPELRGFIKARSRQEALSKNRRFQNIRLLEQLDKDARFDNFFELPPELRLMVYTFLFQGKNCKIGIPVLRTSRIVYCEARVMLYQAQPLYTHAITWRAGTKNEIRNASFYGNTGPIYFNDTYTMENSVPNLTHPTARYMAKYASRLSLMRKMHLDYRKDGTTFDAWAAESLRTYLENLRPVCRNLQVLELDVPRLRVARSRPSMQHLAYLAVALSPLQQFRKEVKIYVRGARYVGHKEIPWLHSLLEKRRAREGSAFIEWILEQASKFDHEIT